MIAVGEKRSTWRRANLYAETADERPKDSSGFDRVELCPVAEPVVGEAGRGQLINVGTCKCLEQNGTTGFVDQWTCVGSDNQLWRSVWNSSGGSALQLKSTGEYLRTDPPPSEIIDGAIPVMQTSLDQYTGWGADNVR